MNPALLQQFEQHVRQTVNPILASSRRKQLMQEELLAHVLACYQQHVEDCKDQPTAAEQALRRFGHPDELHSELQQSVPFLERLFFTCLATQEFPMPRTLSLIGFVAVAFGMALVMPAGAKYNLEGQLPAGEIMVLLTGSVVTLGGLIAIGFGLTKLIRRPS